MQNLDSITWIIARAYSGTRGIVLEASSIRTVARFLDQARKDGTLVDYIQRPTGRHWDGSRLSPARARDIRRGIQRNHAEPTQARGDAA